MYRPEDLKKGLLNLWGWRQHYDTFDFKIAESLTKTETEQYYQDLHPLLTLENIKSISPKFEGLEYDLWDVDATYIAGSWVKFNTTTYRAKLQNQNKQPDLNSEEWEVFDRFSEWLEQKTQAGILKAIRTMWDTKMSAGTAKNILESKTLFNGAGNITDIIENTNSFAGFELVPIRANGVTLKIEKIGLQFTGQGTNTLYLMHSSRKDPVRIIDLQRIRNGSMQWFETKDLYLPYRSEETDAGGSWYLVYNQNELQAGVKAVNKDRDWSKKPCSSCDYSEYAAYGIWSKYLEVHPFKVAAGTATGGDFNLDFNHDFDTAEVGMWDVSSNIYTYSSNYGINLQISIECDITDIILGQKKAFQNIIGLQVAADLIREMAYNPNFNISRTTQNFSRQELLYELDGDSQGKVGGLVNDLNKAMEAVKIDATQMSKICFPCNNKGVRFKAI